MRKRGPPGFLRTRLGIWIPHLPCLDSQARVPRAPSLQHSQYLRASSLLLLPFGLVLPLLFLITRVSPLPFPCQPKMLFPIKTVTVASTHGWVLPEAPQVPGALTDKAEPRHGVHVLLGNGQGWRRGWRCLRVPGAFRDYWAPLDEVGICQAHKSARHFCVIHGFPICVGGQTQWMDLGCS